jgi:hypothetical protein
MSATKTFEGVTYYPYVVSYGDCQGKRRQKTLWSPGCPWLGSEVRRFLEAVDADEKINVYVRAK